jgi:DNA-binding response OmpR family regulator
VEEYLEQGAKDYIVKPSNINILIDILRSIIKKLYSLPLVALLWILLIPYSGISQNMTQDKVELKKVYQLKTQYNLTVKLTNDE